MPNCVIIDDEKDAREVLRLLLKRFTPQIQIVGEAESVKSGLEIIQNLQPDIVFLDINMQDGSGFDLLDQLSTYEFSLVFITAYDQYAIKAFKYAAIDYLLKPIDLKELKTCIARVEKRTEKTNTLEQLSQLQNSGLLSPILRENTSYKKRFITKKTSGIFLLDAADILYFFADDNLVFAVDQDHKKHTIPFRINELEDILSPQIFFRINRSEIININYIQRMEPYFANRLIIQLKGGKMELKTSTSRTAAFRKWLEA